MQLQFIHHGRQFEVDFGMPLDISIPLQDGLENPNCFWAPPVAFTPVVAGNFVGSTAAGSPVNFFNVQLNPHGNGTHTECVGHIAKEKFSINQCLRQFHFLAKLVTVYPTKMPDGDRVVLPQQLKELVSEQEVAALVLRTMPNDGQKRTANYSGTNPPYLHHEAIEWLVACGIQHLLLDLPSVDREEDGGQLLAHRAFWQYGGSFEAIRQNCTITEMIFVDNKIKDGLYLLNLQIASLELDASPSKPVLYRLTEIGLSNDK